VNRIRPKQSRIRLDPDSYEQLRLQVLRPTVGAANLAGPCRTLKFTTKNFAVSAVMIPN
jgi:hypothetical protein